MWYPQVSPGRNERAHDSAIHLPSFHPSPGTRAFAKRFYIEVLGAEVGRENAEWLDILLWGHQITLQKRPEEVIPLAHQGKRHFGVTLPWTEWETQATRIRSMGIQFLSEPEVLLKNTPQEQVKFYLADPNNNVIEVKAYRDVGHTVRVRQ